MPTITSDPFDGPARTKFLHRLVVQARNRARRAHIPFDLPEDCAEQLFKTQKGQCDVTGLAFHLERFHEALVKHPFAPSLDRKLSSGGYTPDNVRLVCVGVNFGMGQWGQELYLRLARAAVALENKPTDVWDAQQAERIAAAEKILAILPPDERPAQIAHIAGLKAARTLGPTGLSARAKKAPIARRAKQGTLERGGD